MCPQQCVLIYQGLKADILPAEPLQLSAVQSLLLKYLSPPLPTKEQVQAFAPRGREHDKKTAMCT